MRVPSPCCSTVLRRTVAVVGAAGLLGAASLGVASLGAQTATDARTRPVVLVSTLRFDGRSANSIEPGDSAVAVVTTARLVAALRASDVVTVVDSASVVTALARADAAGLRCVASVDCVRAIGQRLGARYVVLGKVSKVSGLIWYLSAQLVPVDGGAPLLDEGFELKRGRDDIVPRGGTSLGRRMAEAVGREAPGPA